MTPLDYRNATWDQIQERLEGLRLTAYQAWEQFGPGTTRDVAARAGIDILTFRPRSTELFQLGLLRLVDTVHEGQHYEGLYAAVPVDVARAAHESALDAVHGRAAEQFLLSLSGVVPEIGNRKSSILNS